MTKFPDNSLTWHHKIPGKFPDMGQMAKIPWHFFKIPDFPNLEKILFFPDISPTRGNPVLPLITYINNTTFETEINKTVLWKYWRLHGVQYLIRALNKFFLTLLNKLH